MKTTSFLIAISAIFHLLIIDLVYYTISVNALENFLPLLGYNLVWLVISLSIGTQTTKSRSEN